MVDDYISRKAALSAQNKSMNLAECRKRLERLPTADVVEVRHGRWIDMGDFISCSLCNATRMKEFLCDYDVARRLDVHTNYCPNCGAKMDGGQDGG